MAWGAGDWTFVTLSANPIGGLLVSIPFAVLKLHYPGWLAVALGTPLAYLQVLAVDLGWSLLVRWAWWNRLLEKKRSARVEKLLASRGGFWLTFLASPVLGPWMVMAFMRYAQVPQRKVAVPILLALGCTASVVSLLCVAIPTLFAA